MVWFFPRRQEQQRLRQQLEDGPSKIDKSELTGKVKTWSYQHGLLLRLVWPLIGNEAPASLVEQLEQMISKHIRRWLFLHLSFSCIGLYGKSTKMQILITMFGSKEYKVAKNGLCLTLWDTEDEKVTKAETEVRTGRKWSVTKAVEQAESSLPHQVIVGATNKGQEGPGHR